MSYCFTVSASVVLAPSQGERGKKGTGKKTGQEVIFMDSLPVEEAEKVMLFNCLLALLTSVVGLQKYRDLKFHIDR